MAGEISDSDWEEVLQESIRQGIGGLLYHRLVGISQNFEIPSWVLQTLHQQHAEPRWLGRLRVEVRAYHDASMLEVGMFQSHRKVAVRYQYPNKNMYQQDEKSQQNRFLADWLEHCLQNGHASQPLAVPGQGA